jgi:hypothetical protein
MVSMFWWWNMYLFKSPHSHPVIGFFSLLSWARLTFVALNLVAALLSLSSSPSGVTFFLGRPTALVSPSFRGSLCLPSWPCHPCTSCLQGCSTTPGSRVDRGMHGSRACIFSWLLISSRNQTQPMLLLRFPCTCCRQLQPRELAHEAYWHASTSN